MSDLESERIEDAAEFMAWAERPARAAEMVQSMYWLDLGDIWRDQWRERARCAQDIFGDAAALRAQLAECDEECRALSQRCRDLDAKLAAFDHRDEPTNARPADPVLQADRIERAAAEMAAVHENSAGRPPWQYWQRMTDAGRACWRRLAAVADRELSLDFKGNPTELTILAVEHAQLRAQLAERDAEIARLKSPPAAPEPTLPGARYNKAMADIAAMIRAREAIPADDRVLSVLHRILAAMEKLQRVAPVTPADSLLSATRISRRDCGCSPQLSVGCALDGCPRRTVQS